MFFNILLLFYVLFVVIQVFAGSFSNNFLKASVEASYIAKAAFEGYFREGRAVVRVGGKLYKPRGVEDAEAHQVADKAHAALLLNGAAEVAFVVAKLSCHQVE